MIKKLNGICLRLDLVPKFANTYFNQLFVQLRCHHEENLRSTFWHSEKLTNCFRKKYRICSTRSTRNLQNLKDDTKTERHLIHTNSTLSL